MGEGERGESKGNEGEVRRTARYTCKYKEEREDVKFLSFFSFLFCGLFMAKKKSYEVAMMKGAGMARGLWSCG